MRGRCSALGPHPRVGMVSMTATGENGRTLCTHLQEAIASRAPGTGFPVMRYLHGCAQPLGIGGVRHRPSRHRLSVRPIEPPFHDPPVPRDHAGRETPSNRTYTHSAFTAFTERSVIRCSAAIPAILVEHEHERAIVSFVASVTESSVIELVRTVNELQRQRFYRHVELQIRFARRPGARAAVLPGSARLLEGPRPPPDHAGAHLVRERRRRHAVAGRTGERPVPPRSSSTTSPGFT